MANKERIGITNVLKAIASKVMKLKLRIHFRMQKSTFKYKGKIHATLRAEFNVLDPFLTNFFLFTLFFFLFYPCLIKDFGTHTHTQESLPPHLLSAIH